MNYDITVIGAGIVGLATALKIKEKRPDLNVLIIDKEKQVAVHQTGNNSGVIHSGIYYKPGSLKAKNCVEGYSELLNFCSTVGVEYKLCGKLIVATNDNEIPQLNQIYERGLRNGLNKIKRIDAPDINRYEPHVYGVAALHVPYTGIISFKAVCERIADIFTNMYRGDIKFEQKVSDIKMNSKGAEIITGDSTFKTKLVVNCAGLYSDKIAKMNQAKLNVRIIPFRGEYYELKPEKKHLVKTLIYPVPDPAFPFLGVHFTNMIEGGVEAGPNAVFAFKREAYKKTDFSLKETMEALAWPGFRKVMFKYWKTGLGEYYRSYSKSAFTRALQKLIPEIRQDDLITGGAGVRAQACDKNGGLIDDFVIVEDKNIINILNAPSPAATASFSIGKAIADKAIERF